MIKYKQVKPFDLTDKIALVTGGYGYLGSSMYRGLAGAGAIVYVLGRSEKKSEQCFPDAGPAICFIKCDVAATEDLQKVFNEVYSNHKSFDILVNNAVFLRGAQNPLDITDEDWAYSIDGALNRDQKVSLTALYMLMMFSTGTLARILCTC